MLTLKQLKQCFKNQDIRIFDKDTDRFIGIIRYNQSVSSNIKPDHCEVGVVCKDNGYGANVDPVINAYLSMDDYYEEIRQERANERD